MGFYLYCFSEPVERTFDATPIGASAGVVFSVTEGRIAAVVSETDATEFDPIRRNVVACQRVLDAVSASGLTVVPFRFGTVVSDEGSLREFVRKHEGEILRLLKDLAGCVEMGIKVFWDTQTMLIEIAQSDPEIRREQGALRDASSSTDRLISVGKLLEERLQQRRAALAEQMMTFLANAARVAKVNDVHDDATVLNASFLILREQEPTFDRRVEELDILFDGKFTIRYTGPLLAYSFATIQTEV